MNHEGAPDHTLSVERGTVWRARRNKKTTAQHDWEKVNVSSPQEPPHQGDPLNVAGRDPLVGREARYPACSRSSSCDLTSFQLIQL
jgi:hypothetical protein